MSLQIKTITTVFNFFNLIGFVSKLEIMILSHDLECEMGQFHLRVQICKSEAKLVECLTKENVKQIVKLSHIVDNH
jgi:hypothetical protein